VTTFDLVNYSPHYTQGAGVECIKAIPAALTFDEYRGNLKGQVLGNHLANTLTQVEQ